MRQLVKHKKLTSSAKKVIHRKAKGFGKKSESDEFYIKIYDSVHLEDRHILRTTGEFQGKEWFGNIAVTPVKNQEQYNSDEKAWYGKVLLLFKFFWGSFKEPYELALVR
ncbi:hypothetical protein GLOIN_2v1776597 [Rhizophagus irregularis DAOM 181602=DAOM 197198]|nr:hypothetical protein GLOIN_2v1776597 [Rhizophagus irregularis DAOM 181602=DAOM 197198]